LSCDTDVAYTRPVIVHEHIEAASAISPKRASTIAEIRKRTCATTRLRRCPARFALTQP